MTEKEKELQTEVERLQEWIKEYKKWSKNDAEIHQRTVKENEELTNKIIVDTVKSSGVDLNNREETIIKIITASLFKNEEMLRKVETAPIDKISLSVKERGYELIVSTIPSQTIGIYKTKEEIEEILKRLEIPKEETTTTSQAEEIKENQQTTTNNEEQIQRNCEQIQQLLEQHPNRKIGVLRTAEDICQIREKGTKKVMYEGTAEETLQELKKQLGTEQK